MNSLDQASRALHADHQDPAQHDLEDKVWARVTSAQADQALARRWRQTQMLAASVALVSGIALGGLEAGAFLRAEQPVLAATSENSSACRRSFDRQRLCSSRQTLDVKVQELPQI